jgi:hypothetical protein
MGDQIDLARGVKLPQTCDQICQSHARLFGLAIGPPDCPTRVPAKRQTEALTGLSAQSKMLGPADNAREPDHSRMRGGGSGKETGVGAMNGMTWLILVAMNHDRDRTVIAEQCVMKSGRKTAVFLV